MTGSSEVQVGHPTLEEQLMPLLGAAYGVAGNLVGDRAGVANVNLWENGVWASSRTLALSAY
jgi:hypothetical protein